MDCTYSPQRSVLSALAVSCAPLCTVPEVDVPCRVWRQLRQQYGQEELDRRGIHLVQHWHAEFVGQRSDCQHSTRSLNQQRSRRRCKTWNWCVTLTKSHWSTHIYRGITLVTHCINRATSSWRVSRWGNECRQWQSHGVYHCWWV